MNTVRQTRAARGLPFLSRRHCGCTSYRRFNKMPCDLTRWEQDIGLPWGVLKENEICVGTQFEHR